MPAFNHDQSQPNTRLTHEIAKEMNPEGSSWKGVPRIFVPTFITSLSAFCGLTAIKMSLLGLFEAAVGLILVAAVLDCLDGQAARWLKCTSRFGMELDSLADFLSFGVAPGLIIYFWSLEQMPLIGFVISSIYVLCCAYRLARFNVGTESADTKLHLVGYFQGIPAPAAAVCALLPIIIVFASGNEWPRTWSIDALLITVTALLMIGTFPTFSSKALLPLLKPQVIFLGVTVAAAFLIYNFWGTLTVFILTYIGSLPIASARVRAGRTVCSHRDDQPRNQD